MKSKSQQRRELLKNDTISVQRAWLERLVKHAEAAEKEEKKGTYTAMLIGYASSAKTILELNKG